MPAVQQNLQVSGMATRLAEAYQALEFAELRRRIAEQDAQQAEKRSLAATLELEEARKHWEELQGSISDTLKIAHGTNDPFNAFTPVTPPSQYPAGSMNGNAQYTPAER